MNTTPEPKRLSRTDQLEIFAADAKAKDDQRLNPDELTARLQGFASAKAAREFFKARGAKIDLTGDNLTVTTRRATRKERP